MKSKQKAMGWILAAALAAQTPALAYQPGTLRSGMRGDEVRQMQEALIQLGYLGGVPDGVFGTHTELAVKKFQKENSLKADGVAGAKTLALIYQKAGVTSPAAASAAPLRRPRPLPPPLQRRRQCRNSVAQPPPRRPLPGARLLPLPRPRAPSAAITPP